MATLSHAAVDVHENLEPAAFYRDYVNAKPVLMKNALAGLPAATRWSIPYLSELAPDLPVRLKVGYIARGETVTTTLKEYGRLVDDVVANPPSGGEPPPYLHDLPLFSMIPELRADMEPFPTEYLPRFFRRPWWVFPQFFVGPPGATTTLHFDTLQTHNFFYQLHGSKRFLIVHPEDRKYCYTYNWRWSHVDAENPDLSRHPLFQRARIQTCLVEAGDVLYMPPGALHHVRSLSPSISFNIDWHDRHSALRGLTAVRHGMPRRNLWYNLLLGFGVYTGVPVRYIMTPLRPYFTYIS
ncbi:cupin-like domain-containing protein [Actinomadura macra]|uniref:cupin-like domain-containing protein n=1 Tax=Actinomadura macra TaxID=46164 RepID=UPI000835F6BD|nr:cupin-like domain-containing protein [Actinomadura macra]